MKRLLLITSLVLLAVPARAETCTGRVEIFVADGSGLYPKGSWGIDICNSSTGGDVAKRILRTCSNGSRCRVEFTSEGDNEISKVISVKRVR